MILDKPKNCIDNQNAWLRLRNSILYQGWRYWLPNDYNNYTITLMTVYDYEILVIICNPSHEELFIKAMTYAINLIHWLSLIIFRLKKCNHVILVDYNFL